MRACRLNALRIEALYCCPPHLLLFESGQRHIDGLHLVTYCVPSLLDYLAALFVAHQWKLAFYLGGGLSLVDSIGADSFDLNSTIEVAFCIQLLLLAPELIRKGLYFLVLLLVPGIEMAMLGLEWLAFFGR